MHAQALKLLTAARNRQGIFGGFNINGVEYQLESGGHGWHITAFPGRDPINIYWVSGTRFYSAKIHLLTEPASEIRLETFDEISFIQPDEKTAVLAAIAAWEGE